MNIQAIIVSVNYADLLSRSIGMWTQHLSRLTIVTDYEDRRSADLAVLYGAHVHQTNIFYEHGAYFNKGAAIQSAIDSGAWDGGEWCLLLDADVVSPKDWMHVIHHYVKDEDVVYGARRKDVDKSQITYDPNPCGFFMLFHAKDSHLGSQPWVNVNYVHAGNYDSDLVNKWPVERRRMLPLTLTHYGKSFENWCGVGEENRKALRGILTQRATGKSSWQNETIVYNT